MAMKIAFLRPQLIPNGFRATSTECYREWVLKNSPFLENSQNSGIQNALKSEGIAYNESSRNFIFANLAKKSFSTATRFFTNNPPI
jgi:hypothetical protein